MKQSSADFNNRTVYSMNGEVYPGQTTRKFVSMMTQEIKSYQTIEISNSDKSLTSAIQTPGLSPSPAK